MVGPSTPDTFEPPEPTPVIFCSGLYVLNGMVPRKEWTSLELAIDFCVSYKSEASLKKKLSFFGFLFVAHKFRFIGLSLMVRICIYSFTTEAEIPGAIYLVL